MEATVFCFVFCFDFFFFFLVFVPPRACSMGDVRLVLSAANSPERGPGRQRRAPCMNEAFSVDMGHASRCTQ